MKKKVIVYSTPNCPYCIMAKNFLKQYSIEFEEINVLENKEAATELIKKTGQNGVPVIEVGNDIIIGFNKEELKKKLNIK